MKIAPFIALLLMVLIVSCNQSETAQDGQEEIIEQEEVVYDDLSEMQYFVVEPGEVKEEDGIPTMPLILATEGRGNVLITDAPSYMPIENSEFESIGIPESAKFAFNTFYAGGGYYYYGNVEDNRLKIYRKITDAESTETFDFELFKTVGYTSKGEIIE